MLEELVFEATKKKRGVIGLLDDFREAISLVAQEEFAEGRTELGNSLKSLGDSLKEFLECRKTIVSQEITN